MKNGVPTLLVAEDDENDFLVLGRALRKANFETDLRRVRDGAEVIGYLAGENGFADRDSHPLPELLLLDLKMPGKGGLDVLIWLRKHEMLKSLPAVVLSASDNPNDMQQARAMGATAYLVKPSAYDGYPKVVQALRDLWRAGTGAQMKTTICTLRLRDGKEIIAKARALTDDAEVEVQWSGVVERLQPVLTEKYSPGFLRWYLQARAFALGAQFEFRIEE
jgi:Response regulators consisting of a CheY-like receiver domain and a winged-helix DNA-binding domain